MRGSCLGFQHAELLSLEVVKESAEVMLIFNEAMPFVCPSHHAHNSDLSF